MAKAARMSIICDSATQYFPSFHVACTSPRQRIKLRLMTEEETSGFVLYFIRFRSQAFLQARQ